MCLVKSLEGGGSGGNALWPSSLLPTTRPCTHSAFQWTILLLTGSKGDGKKKTGMMDKLAFSEWNIAQAKTTDKFNKSDKKSLRLTHSEICCFSSPLSDRHQCRGTISERDLNVSLGIGAMEVLRNAASRLFSAAVLIHRWAQKKRFHRSIRSMPAAGQSLNCLRKC